MTQPHFFIIASAGGSRTPLEITATKKGITAYINIKGYIYKWNTASSSDIEKTIKDFVKDGATHAELYINTGGGDCFEANEITNLVDDNFKAENIHVRVGALAASAGTYFLTKYPSSAKKNSQFMIHKPMGNPSGNEDEIENGLQLIKNMTNQYRSAYATKMSITEKEVDKLWGKGDYWMTASEALEKGLIDSIEDEDEKIDAKTRMQLVACGAPNIPQVQSSKNQKTNIMDKEVLCAQLGLPADSTEAQITAKINQLKIKANTATQLEASAKLAKEATEKASVKALLDSAEKDKKINAAQRGHFEALATANFESTKSIIDGMKSIEPVSGSLDPSKPDAGEDAKKANWTFADYQEKDQEAFEKLTEAKQNQLIEAHYKDS